MNRRHLGRWQVFCAAILLLCAPAVAQQDALAGRMRAASELLEAGDLDQAELSFLSLMAEVPDRAEPYLGLQEVFLQRGEPAQALPLVVPAAERWLEAGDYSQAGRVLRAVAEANPETGRVQGLLGRSAALDRQFRAAQGPLERAVALGERDQSTLLLLGSTLWENGSLGKAEEVLSEAAAAAGGDPMLARHQLGRLWLWQGRFEEATTALEEVGRSRPDWPGVGLDRARAYQGAGEFEAARREFDLYLAVHPEDAGALYGSAQVLAALGEREAATEQMRRYQDVRDADRRSVLERGHLEAEIDQALDWLRSGQVQQALEQLEGMPETVEVLTARARIHVRLGQRDEAIASLEDALSLDPERRDLRSELQRLYLEARLEADGGEGGGSSGSGGEGSA
jgi:Tfp pilus assembly protein PilF